MLTSASTHTQTHKHNRFKQTRCQCHVGATFPESCHAIVAGLECLLSTQHWLLVGRIQSCSLVGSDQEIYARQELLWRRLYFLTF